MTTERQIEIGFEGTTEECLAHYVGQFPMGEVSSQALQPIAEFFGAPRYRRLIQGWLTGRAKPQGENLIKIRFFLQSRGYRVVELEWLTPTVRQLGVLVAHNVENINSLVREIGYGSRDSLVEVLRGKQGFSLRRLRMIDEILARHQSHFPSGLPETVQRKEVSLVSQEPLPSRPRRLRKVTNGLPGHRGFLTILAHLIQASVPLLEQILSEEFSAEERRELRKLTGGDTIFRFSNLLEKLCSEQARKQIPAYDIPEGGRRK
ncbi:MAG: hypothetical protein HY459_00935 [Parcubacteria group bacterium]|nr:hypothetical protein [Parcubacteria group bacterium]